MAKGSYSSRAMRENANSTGALNLLHNSGENPAYEEAGYSKPMLLA